MITLYFGVPGCGKTTILTALAQKELRRIARGKSKYEHVLTNFECEGCERVEFFDIGVYDIEKCLILLDEVTVDADNRDFKNFPKSAVRGYVYHRHYDLDIIMATQQYDAVDKKIRNLTFNLYTVSKGYLFPFIKAKKVFRTVDIDEHTHDIVVGYRWANFKEIVVGTFFPSKLNGGICRRFFAPAWFKYFDSKSKPLQLQEFSYKKWTDVKGVDDYVREV